MSTEDVVCFTVPFTPVSVNHHTRPCKYIGKDGYLHTGRTLTPSARAYKDAVAIFAQRRTVAPATQAERRKVKYRVHVDVYLGPNQRLDTDNGGKLICDSLQKAGVIHSDAFIEDFQVRTHKDERFNPRTTFFITRMENE